MSTYDHFYDLPVYKKCRSFRIKISKVVKTFFPISEQYGLKAQLLNSSRSITANIAEGFGRFHYQENIQFCRQSRGSLTETMDHLISAFDEKYITLDILKDFNMTYKDCLKELNTYVKYLKSTKITSNNQ